MSFKFLTVLGFLSPARRMKFMLCLYHYSMTFSIMGRQITLKNLKKKVVL